MKINDKNKKITNGIEDDWFEFEKLVQTTQHSFNEYIINLDGDINKAEYYREAFDTMRYSKERDRVKIIMNSYGGYVYTFVEFYHYITNCKSKVVCELHTAYSAGSLIALCCDEIELSAHASMMIHNVSYGAYGKANEIKSQSDFEIKHAKEVMKEIYKDFLSPDEIKEVLRGEDLWLTRKEIEKRLLTWIPIRER